MDGSQQLRGTRSQAELLVFKCFQEPGHKESRKLRPSDKLNKRRGHHKAGAR
jgi:hypothetical protein